MWSFGCILYELYVGYPLFPGEDEKDHMALMMEVKGIPPRSVLARSTRRKVFFDDDYNPIITPNSRGKIRMPQGKNLYTAMNCSDRDFVDFIDVSYTISFLIFNHFSNYRNASNGNLNSDWRRNRPSHTHSSQELWTNLNVLKTSRKRDSPAMQVMAAALSSSKNWIRPAMAIRHRREVMALEVVTKSLDQNYQRLERTE